MQLRSLAEGSNKSSMAPCPRFCNQQNHKGEVVEFSCKTCKSINICQQCLIMSHAEHEVVRINQVADDCLYEMLTKKESLHGEMSSLRLRVEQLEQAMVITEQKFSKERQKISTMINSSVKALQRHHQEIASEIDKIYQSYAQSATEEKRKLKIQLARMTRVMEQVESVVTNKKKTDSNESVSALLKRFDEVLKFKCCLDPIKTLQIEYIYDNVTQVPNGQIVSSSKNLQLNSTKNENYSHAQSQQGENSKGEPTSRKISAEVHLTVPSLTFNNESGKDTSAVSRKHSNSLRKAPDIVRQSLVLDHRYSASAYMPHLQFAQEICPPLSCELIPKGAFGGTGKGKGEFRKPKGIALNSKGELAIADSMNHRVQILAATGDFVRQIGRKGSGNGDLQHPVSVAFDSCDNIIVSDTTNCSVQMFSPVGKFVRKIGAKEVKSPYGVAVSSERNIIVCDVSDHTVKVFSSSGEVLLRKIGAAIEIVPECTRHGPYFAVYHNEQYLVSYCGGNHCVKIFDKKGNYIRSIGKEGKNAGELFCPRGIAVSTRDHILVCDSGNHRIQVFTLDGRFVGKFGTKGMGLGQFDRLDDLAISQGSRVFITDGMNDRVEYFDY